MKYKAIIFDLDGTLLDTIDDLADSVRYALSRFDLPEITTEQAGQYVGNGVLELMRKSVPDGDDNPLFPQALETFKTYYAEHSVVKTRPYPGIIEMLSVLSEKGVKTAIVSNKYDNAVQQLFQMFFSKYIDFAFGERSGVSRKPAPDLVLEAMGRLGCSKQETLYVGDSDVDVVTARNAGLACAAVTWGLRDRETLKSAGAKIFIDHPLELFSLLTD